MSVRLSLLASEFPEDPVLVLRAAWQFLAAYYVVATVIVLFVWKALKASRFVYSTKQRLITAAVLAAIFAPSEVSDFFLFNLPGPAAAGLFMLLIAMALIIFSQPSALLTASFGSGLAKRWARIICFRCSSFSESLMPLYGFIRALISERRQIVTKRRECKTECRTHTTKSLQSFKKLFPRVIGRT